MQKTNWLKKGLISAVAFTLVGAALPGASYASTSAKSTNSDQLIQQIFAQVGLRTPSIQQPASNGKTSVTDQPQTTPQADSNQTATPQTEDSQTATPEAGDSQTTSPETTESNQPATNNQTAAPQQTQAQASFGDRIIKTGEKYMGTPYKFGARSGQTSNFDCSSFVQYVFGQNGVKLPRTSSQQSKVGTEVSRNQLQKGDLVFFKLRGSNGRIAHVGIYAGNGKLLHTWGSGGVRYDKMSAAWLDWGFVKATRVTSNN
ncbi:C40 family peptidase [Desmospora activa]|uniref:Cell wall-associated NlpC family hydrolase n=1 Tax=Desmospora activa DSM 45169 TaxID=1121389 RepID=A0A2T4Z3Q6_9BACL|nr:C40 family peptidase [Desmospora activa]PTM56515.1 cell wall-associated NlpC family hydrolase [Desmospora activa DSM 45169]